MTNTISKKPDTEGAVEFNGFEAHVRRMGVSRIGKFRVIVGRKVPGPFKLELACWGTFMEAKAYALGVMTALATVEERLSNKEALPLGIGEEVSA